MPAAHSQYRPGASTQSETIHGTAPRPCCAIGQSSTTFPRCQMPLANQRSET